MPFCQDACEGQNYPKGQTLLSNNPRICIDALDNRTTNDFYTLVGNLLFLPLIRIVVHRRPPDRGIIRGTDPTFFAIQSLSPRLSFVEFSESHIAEARRSLKHVQIAIAPSIERFLALNHALKDDSSQFMNEIRGYVHNGDVDGAKKLANSTDTAIGRMIAKGLSRLGRPLSDIQTAVENEGKMEVAKLEKHVSLVATVASLGPMLGFLGTVTGMVSAFQAMAHAGNNIDISNLAGGIYQAMVTTVGGLIVGIIAYFLYNLLVNRINKVVMQLESRSMEFMDLLHEPA